MLIHFTVPPPPGGWQAIPVLFSYCIIMRLLLLWHLQQFPNF
ncbi:hypothetical protein CLOSTASPAR_03860 [[Clostridium] asparagiforme DSM 15981]|uniref:Uncharacterized protein n=1 Tax=[Clostridium] asparagiforme DSM 15981 TaxID=518636 RepID=C0D3L9_9FIRM|nr:hypothetical protein CLOSTASPAR_03860 [[Clostridium] asparagiforme DSM 15981]